MTPRASSSASPARPARSTRVRLLRAAARGRASKRTSSRAPAGVLNVHHELGLDRKALEALADHAYSPADVGAAIASGSFAVAGDGGRAVLDEDARRRRARPVGQPADARRRRGAQGAPPARADGARDAVQSRAPAQHDRA